MEGKINFLYFFLFMQISQNLFCYIYLKVETAPMYEL